VVVSNSATVSTSSGALQIQNGGLGVGGGVFVGGIVTATLFSGSLAGGAGGAILYQTATNATGFVSTATAGNFLQANFNGAPTWTTTGSMYVNSAVYAEDLLGGVGGQLPYQSAANVTAFISTATAGNFLQANFNGAPTWTTTASMYVGRAAFADSSSGSSAQVNTQARPDNGTNFLTFVDSNNASATGELVYTTSSVYVNPSTGLVTGDSFYATNNGNGTNFRVGDNVWIGDINVSDTLRITGQQNTANAYIVFGASDTTALGRAGTGGLTYGGNLIIHAGNTSTAYVGNAVKVETSLQTANASYYPVFVDANNSTAVPESVYTTSTFLINPGTRQVGIGYISTSSALTVNGRIESMTDPAGEGGQLVLRGRTYRWSFDNYYDTFRIIREDDVTEANGTSPFQISSGTTSVLIGYTNAAPTVSGEKLGVSGGVYVNGILTATTIYGTFAGTIGGSVTINTATNLASGTAGQLVYQSAPGATSFVSTATTGNFLQANFTSAPTWTTSGTMYVGNAVQAETIKGGGNGSLLYQSAANTTSFLSTGTPGQLLMAAVGAPAFTNTSSIYVNSSRFADELTGAGTGNIVVQVGTNDTQFLSTGTTGQLLVAAGGRPIFTNTSSISVGYAANILGVGTGGILYESANNTTSILSTGTPGQLLMAAVGAPAFTNTSSIYVNSSRYADNLTGGGVGSIPIQSAAGTTSFVPLGTSGFVLTAGATTATWQAVSTLAAGTATNIANGLANQLVYQTAPGTTGFISTSTTGNFLQATTNGAPSWTGTASMQVGYAANLLGAGTGNILIQSANNTTSFLSTGTAGQLLMSAGGAPVFINTASVYVGLAVTVDTVRQTTDQNYYPTMVGTLNAARSANFVYTTSSFRINAASGLMSLSGRLAVNNTDSSTGTNTDNALYVAGGAWINKNLTVAGDTTFQGSVVFQGTNTFVYSSSTVYTDNLISLHAPGGSGPGNHTWTLDDGKDIGFMFHYYKTTDKDAFLGFDNATSYLEWFDNGVESGGVFTGTSFGTFRTGAIKLVGGAVNSGNTTSGDLTVLGGVGIGQDLYVAGNINVAGTINASITGISTTATNLAGGSGGTIPYQSATGVTAMLAQGSIGSVLITGTGGSAPSWASQSSLNVGNATNLNGGTTGQLVFQTGTAATSFVGPGTAGQLLVSAGASVTGPVFTSTSSIYVNSARFADELTGGAAGGLPYQSGANNTTFLAVGSAGNFLTVNSAGNAPQWSNTGTSLFGYAQNLAGGTAGQFVYQSAANTTAFIGTGSMYVNSARFADELTGGAAGSIPYQSGANDTTFLAIGTNGFVLTSNGSAPVWQAISGLSAGSATTATNLAAGTVGQIPFQTAAGATSFFGAGTAGQLLMSAGTTSTGPVFTNTSSIYVNSSRFADELTGGAVGGLPYQSGANDTTFLAVGSAGNFLTVNSAGTAPQWSSTATSLFGYSRNIAGGQAWQIPYQSAPSTTAFANSGTTGQFWQATTNGAPTWTNTSSMFVNSARFADELTGGAAGSIPYQSGANDTSFLGIGTNGFVLTSNGSAPTWAALSGLASGSATTATNLAGGTAGQLPYQSAVGVTAFTGPGSYGQFLMSTGASAPVYQSTLTQANGNIIITSNTAATSTTTGALRVVNGGAGIGGSVYVGSTVTSAGFFTPAGFANRPDSSCDVATNSKMYAGLGINIGAALGGDITFGQNFFPSIIAGTPSTIRAYVGNDVTNSQLWYGNSSGLVVGNGTTILSGAKLTVNGGAYVNGTLTATNFVGSFTGGVTGAASQVQTTAQSTNATYYLTFVDANNATAAAETVYTTSSFTINAQSGKLSVSGSNSSSAPLLDLTATGTGTFQRGVRLLNSGMSNGDHIMMAVGTADSSYNMGQFYFYKAGTGSTSNRVSMGLHSVDDVFNIVGTSHVGIGTTGPVNKLEVKGTFGGPLTSGSSQNGIARFSQTSGGGSLDIGFGDPYSWIQSRQSSDYSTNYRLALNPNGGNVCIGTTSTTNKFEVAGTAGQLFSISDTFTGTIFSANDISGIPSIEVLDTGLVKLAQYNGQVTISTGTAVSGSGLSVWTSTYILSLGVGTSGSGTIGEIRATNEVTAYYSDRRLKENVQVIDNAVTKVLSLNGITYSPNDLAASYGYDKNVKLVGLFADEVEAVLPEATRPAPFDQDESGNSKSGENYKTIQYEKLVPLLIEAIKEQQKSIDLLKDELYQLKNRK
jgi:hypothetical protein